jgi:hypothetical protein
MSTVGATPPLDPGPAVGEEDLLLDRYLPRFDVTVIEHRVIDADIATVWRSLSELDLMRVHTPLMDAAMSARGLPATIASAFGRQAPPPPPPPELRLRGSEVPLDGWLSLGEREGREIAFGAVGRFWQADIDWYDVTGMTPQDFAAFHERGWGRIAASFSLRPYGAGRTLASYEARTATPDPDSAKRFQRYWMVVRPFVGHIMRATLASLELEAADRAD